MTFKSETSLPLLRHYLVSKSGGRQIGSPFSRHVIGSFPAAAICSSSSSMLATSAAPWPRGGLRG